MAKLRSLLLDTGPAVAFLDRADPEHQWATRELSAFSGRLHTTTAVITEVMHFVAPRRRGPALFAEFLRSTKTVVHGWSGPKEISQTAALMERYWDSRMDYADATLLLLAEQISTFEILTLDRRGFAFFRTPAGRPLQIVRSGP
ncbi:MAG: PIN domain-containing protein [Bryobacterales bacterium]|nr:PIN domain-containing protein [Bryobacterales bacterium]